MLGAYGESLVEWGRLAWTNELYSHLPLIPCVSAYLIWINRRCLPARGQPSYGAALACGLLGAAVLGFYWVWKDHFESLALQDRLAPILFSLLCWILMGSYLFLGSRLVRGIRFPLLFLAFMVPLPTLIQQGFNTALQYASVVAAHGFLWLAGMPMIAHGLSFQMPGMTIQVAPECSGIRSTLVLIITSILAAHLFLRSPWKKAVFLLTILPLGILRNGFRVFVIAEMCVHWGPQMIDSPLHRRGGPVFFVLALIPLFALLLFLRKLERRSKPPATDATPVKGDASV